MGGFKNYCVLSFIKGVLLEDHFKLLEFPGKNTQSAKVIKFVSESEVIKSEGAIMDLILQAIQIEKEGKKVKFKKISEHQMPFELLEIFKSQPNVHTAFKQLTPGRQRSYLLYFGSAKQSHTRISRIEKHIPNIIAGKGLND